MDRFREHGEEVRGGTEVHFAEFHERVHPLVELIAARDPHPRPLRPNRPAPVQAVHHSDTRVDRFAPGELVSSPNDQADLHPSAACEEPNDLAGERGGVGVRDGLLQRLADRVYGLGDLAVLDELVPRADDRDDLGRVASADAAVGVERLALGAFHLNQVVEGDQVGGGKSLVRSVVAFTFDCG